MTHTTDLAIDAHRLRKEFGKKVAVKDFTLEVSRGEVFGFLGPNGAGKTTAVKMMMGLVHPTAGEAALLGKPLGDPLRDVKDISGGTVLGDGNVILILDIPSIIESAEGTIVSKIPISSAIKDLSKKKKNILLAEDVLTTAMLEKNVLESVGYSVVIARDGQEALKTASQERFDLVITDVLMPKMDGFELTNRLKKDKYYKNVPIIELY